MGDYLYRGMDWALRRARPEDGQRLAQLLRRVHVKGTIDITQERDPDFFALLRLHLGEFDVWVAEDRQKRVGAFGTVIVRPGWVDEQIRPVGYLVDLRALPGFRAIRHLPMAHRMALDYARVVHGAEIFHTVIFDSNRGARRTLVEHRNPERRLGYVPLTPFNMTSVQFTLGKGRPGRIVHRATERDWDELVTFLARGARQRCMSHVLDEALLKKRLATWPGLTLESFYIARDRGGSIVGTFAPWNPHTVKRTRVLGYHGHMRVVRSVFNLFAHLGRFPRLPPPGACFRFVFLSHLEIAEDDPGVLRDLLCAAYSDLRGRGLHFMSAMIPRGSPLERAFRGFVVNRNPMTLYALSLSDKPLGCSGASTMRPGFEMALS